MTAWPRDMPPKIQAPTATTTTIAATASGQPALPRPRAGGRKSERLTTPLAWCGGGLRDWDMPLA